MIVLRCDAPRAGTERPVDIAIDNHAGDRTFKSDSWATHRVVLVVALNALKHFVPSPCLIKFLSMAPDHANTRDPKR